MNDGKKIEDEDKQELAEDRTEKASERTQYAEDRTLLANERTFAGWSRTSLACIGVGLGFQAIFRSVEPTWVAKSIATALIMLGVFVIWQAHRRAAELFEKKSGNGVRLMDPTNFKVMAIAISVVSAVLIGAIWFLI